MADREKKGNRGASLSLRQERFIEEYLLGRTAAEAYRLAGYTGKDAQRSGWRVLNSKGVKEELERRRKRRDEQYRKREMDLKERTLEEIAAIAFSDLGDYLAYHTEWENGEEKIVLSYRDSEQVDTRNLASVTISGNQLKISLYDKQKALFKLFDRFYLRGEETQDNRAREIFDALLQAAQEGFSQGGDEDGSILQETDSGDELVDGS